MCAPFEHRCEHDAEWGEFDSVLCSAVRSTTHLDYLEETKQMAHSLDVTHHDDAVCDRFFNPKGGPVSVFCGRGDFRDEDGGASEGCEFLSEGEQEITNQLLGLNFVA